MISTWRATEPSGAPSYLTSTPIFSPAASAPAPPLSKNPTPVTLGMKAICAPSALPSPPPASSPPVASEPHAAVPANANVASVAKITRDFLLCIFKLQSEFRFPASLREHLRLLLRLQQRRFSCRGEHAYYERFRLFAPFQNAKQQRPRARCPLIQLLLIRPSRASVGPVVRTR